MANVKNGAIEKILTVSTSHLSKSDRDYLIDVCAGKHDYDFNAPMTLKGEYGWVVYCNSIFLVSTNLDKTHPVLYKVMSFADQNDCSWVCFDVDGVVLEELDTYSW